MYAVRMYRYVTRNFLFGTARYYGVIGTTNWCSAFVTGLGISYHSYYNIRVLIMLPLKNVTIKSSRVVSGDVFA